MNQKSLDKNKPKELEWEKQFDERFNGELWFGYDEQELPKNEQSESRLEVKYFIKTILEKNNYDWSELLQKQRTELLEEIKKEVKDSFVKADKHKWNNESIQQWVLYKITNFLNKKDEQI